MQERERERERERAWVSEWVREGECDDNGEPTKRL